MADSNEQDDLGRSRATFMDRRTPQKETAGGHNNVDTMARIIAITELNAPTPEHANKHNLQEDIRIEMNVITRRPPPEATSKALKHEMNGEIEEWRI